MHADIDRACCPSVRRTRGTTCMYYERVHCYQLGKRLLLITVTYLSENIQCSMMQPGPSRGGKVFPSPATFGGLRRRSKILQMVFQMASFRPKICTKSILGRGCAPDPTGGAYDAPPNPSQMARGHPSPCFLPLNASRSQDIQNGKGD